MVKGEADGVSGAFHCSVLDWTASAHPGYPLGLCGSAPPGASSRTVHPVFTRDVDSVASGTPNFLA